MTRIAFAVLVSSVVAVAATAAQASGLNVRTGQWAITTSGMTGTIPGMESLPPDVRAKAEAEMRAPHTDTSCITADDLNNLNLGKMDDDSDCTVISKTVTRSVADVTRQCKGDSPRTDVMHVEATSPESIKASYKSTTGQGTMAVTFTGKWAGATCKKDN